MISPPGYMPDLSSTARLAAKGTNSGIQPAVIRRTVTALVALTGMRRSEARQIIRSFETPEELDAYMRATFHLDPVGVTAARNVDREARR